MVATGMVLIVHDVYLLRASDEAQRRTAPTSSMASFDVFYVQNTISGDVFEVVKPDPVGRSGKFVTYVSSGTFERD